MARQPRQRLRTRKPDAESVQLSIQLPADVFDAVKALAVETDRSLSGMITRLLRAGLEVEQ